MKKFLLTLAMLAIAIGMVVATPGEYVTNNLTTVTTDKATLEVTLDLSSTSNLNKHYQIGFTNEPVNATTTIDSIDARDPLTTIELDLATTSGDVANSNPAYVYWAIKAPVSESIKIGLSLPGNMISEGDETTGVKWSVTPGSVTPGSGPDSVKVSTDVIATTNVSTGDSNEAVVTITGTGTMVTGSFPITISTVDLRTTTTVQEEYSSTLTVTIKNT